ncbi:MAG: peptidoglycan DD-metalloendopeptidase family protein [Eubacterium sp.]|nr:peptidoglycan DD-metalloendopeptidase family protein [Eubacterium sp.]
MKTKASKKLIAILLSLLLMLSSAGLSAYANETTTLKDEKSTTEQITEKEEDKVSKEEAQQTLEEQKKDLEKKLKENEKLLASFEEDAKVTAQYIDALDEKIGYINEELNILDKQIAEAKSKVDELSAQIAPLEKQLKVLEKEYDKAKEEFDKLSDEFDKIYNAYCLRLRAMYISGRSGILAALLTSKDLSQFITRIEMIRAVSRADAQLLKKVNAKMEQIITRQDGLNEKKAAVLKARSELDEKKKECVKQQKSIESKQQEVASKKVSLSENRAQSDSLFAQYSAKTQMYTEFRNEDEELVKSVDNEIDALLSGLKAPDEVTTAKSAEHNPDDYNGGDSDENSLYSGSNAVLNLTYPAPGHYAVSQEYGHYRNGRPHTGIDFPYPTGSKVVAAQKGIVIKVKRLNYSYGYYIMIYHGTDAKGRKIVTLYAHNSSILVSVGQSVKKGEQIAKGGSTGNSTGPHCHFEMIIDGAKVNPKNYLSR